MAPVFDPSVFDPAVFDTGSSPDMDAAGDLTLTGSAELLTVVRMSAAGSLVLTGAAELSAGALMAAVGSLVLSAAAALQTGVLLDAEGDLVLIGEATDFFVARHAQRLKACGDPLSTACQEWMP